MALFSGLLVLGLVCALSLCAAAALGWDAALLPLPTLAAGAVLLSLCGCFGVLGAGAWAVPALLLLGAVYSGVRAGAAALQKAACSPGLWLFAGASAFFWVLFAVQRPMFTQWDEFTAWGAAAKLVKTMDALYVAQPYSLTASHSLPGSSMVCYLFAAFSPAFSEWACFAAVDTLLLACAAAAAAIAAPKARWPQSVLVFGAAALLPLLFQVLPAGAVGTAYRTLMADMPMGFLFGGALCAYFAAPARRSGAVLALAPLALLALYKDIAFAYSLIAAFVIALDWLCCPPQKTKPSRALPGALGVFALTALPGLLAFLGWNAYVAAADTAAAAGVGSAGLGYGAVLLGGVRQLLGIGREEGFARLMALMARAFFGRRVFLAGGGAAAVALLAVMAALGRACAPKGAARRRPLAACAGLAVGFAALYAFHLILYHYNFAASEALVLKDYERYLGPYYAGWALTAFCLLGQGAAAGAKRAPAALAAAALAVAACVAWRGIPAAGFWSDVSSLYTVRTDVQRRAAAMNAVLDWPDRVLVLSQGDDATRWYYYKYELTATVVNGWAWDEAAGTCIDGDFMNLVPEAGSDMYTYTTRGDLAQLRAHMDANACAYLLIDRSDGYLAGELGPAVAGGLGEAGPAALYRYLPGQDVCFVPVAVAESGVATG